MGKEGFCLIYPLCCTCLSIEISKEIKNDKDCVSFHILHFVSVINKCFPNLFFFKGLGKIKQWLTPVSPSQISKGSSQRNPKRYTCNHCNYKKLIVVAVSRRKHNSIESTVEASKSIVVCWAHSAITNGKDELFKHHLTTSCFFVSVLTALSFKDFCFKKENN